MTSIKNALFVAAVAFSFVASAGEPPKQNHHCQMPDGQMDMAKTKKECGAAKGKWVKDAAEPKADAAKADAPAKTDAPAKADAPAPAPAK
ncbi:MAG: hypothetical protein QM723_30540 [Myxococcaceae bacterium]